MDSMFQPASADSAVEPSSGVPLNATRIALVDDLTYLGFVWLTAGARAHPPAADHGMSFADARTLWPTCRTSARFSFLLRMRDGLRTLLHTGEPVRLRSPVSETRAPPEPEDRLADR